MTLALQMRSPAGRPPRHAVLTVAAAAAMLLTLLSAATPTLASSPAAETGPTKPCRVEGWPNELRCGQIERPLNPAEPQGRKITVHYLLVPAKSRSKLPDPIVLFAGGPGQSATRLAPKMIGGLSGLNNRRDLIFIDQRGTGLSAPLQCPDARGLPMAEAMSGAGQLRLLQRCSAELQKLPHGDLRFYTTTVAMQDFDAVRQQLGVQRWNLIGASYGTRAALEYHRQFPQAVRRTLLDGMAPPDQTLPDSMSADAQAALDRVFSACEENARCTQAYPQLRTRWQQLLQSLPREVKLPHPLSGAPEGVMLEREALLRAVRLPLYTPAMTAALPAALHAATQSRFEGLAGLASGMGMSGKDRLFDGMHFSVICAEDGPRLAAEGQSASGRDFGDADARLYRQVCAQWPRGEVPAAFYKISAAQSPVLLLSGGADPVTPPRHGQRVAEALGTKALHLVAPNAGHGVMRTTCLREPLLRFFNAASDDEALALKADCLERMPRALPFIPPGTPKPAASEVSK